MTTFQHCVLHIGTEKTGTTSIQKSFYSNRSFLKSKGFLYPLSLGRENHTNLVAYARDDDTTDNQRKRALHHYKCDIQEFRNILKKKFAKEVKSNDCPNLLLSNEHLHSRLTNLREKRRLKKFLDGFCKNYTIVVYLRRQDKVAASLFSTRLKAGGKDFDNVLPAFGKIPYYYNYKEILEQYSEIFGQENIVVREFDKKKLFRADVVYDIYHTIGINSLNEIDPVEAENESIDIHAQKFLSVFNRINPPFIDNTPNPLRGGIDKIIGKKFSGKGKTISKDEAIRFMEQFKRNNSWVNRTFLGGRGSLFDENFSSYPEDLAFEIIPEKLIEIGTFLFKEAQREIIRQKAEVLYRIGLLRSKEKDSLAAKSCFLRAIELDPKHSDAHRQLRKICK